MNERWVKLRKVYSVVISESCVQRHKTSVYEISYDTFSKRFILMCRFVVVVVGIIVFRLLVRAVWKNSSQNFWKYDDIKMSLHVTMNVRDDQFFLFIHSLYKSVCVCVYCRRFIPLEYCNQRDNRITWCQRKY